MTDSPAKRLGEAEWVHAGLRTLAREGIEAVRVERLAQELNVTKGSFYWHFKDRAALLTALLEAWRSLATGAVIDEVEAQAAAKGGDARAKLATLFAIVFRSDGRLERAVRAWAATDTEAADAVAAIDRRRLGYVTAQMQATGLPKADSKARARFVYYALIGQFTVMDGFADGRRMADDLDMIVPMLLTAPSPSDVTSTRLKSTGVSKAPGAPTTQRAASARASRTGRAHGPKR